MRTRYPQQQRQWFIDPANGSDDNTGEDAGHPIKTDRERNFRLGPMPTFAAGDYHVHLLGDITTGLAFRGTCLNSNIYVHASATHGAGASALFAGTIDAGTVAQNKPANTPWQIKANSIPTSWTASGLMSKRLRLTSGGAAGGTSWAMRDLGTKTARCCQVWGGPAAYAYPFVTPLAAVAPSEGDAFVVESLRVVSGQVLVDLRGTGANLIFESCDFSSATFGCTGSRLSFYGCNNPVVPSAPPSQVDLTSGLMPAGIFAMYGLKSTLIRGGCGIGTDAVLTGGADTNVLQGFMKQDARIQIAGGSYGNDNSGWLVFDVACFDCSVGLCVKSAAITLTDNFIIWGSGNAITMQVRTGGQVVSHQNPITRATHLPVTSTSADLEVGGNTSLPVFNRATRQYTNDDRVLSWDNVLATIDNGGFCNTVGVPKIVDPNSNACFAVHQL
jgi:hypothetical protein